MATDVLHGGGGAAPRSALALLQRRLLGPVVAGLALTAILIGLCWSSGGYFPTAYLTAGGAAFGVLAIVLVIAPPHYRLSRSAILAVTCLGGLVAWTGLSALWSPDHDAAIAAMQRDLAYLGVFGLALVAAGSGRYARHVLWGVLVVIAVVLGASLLSRLYPNLVHSPGVAQTISYRLGYPLTYWNALGCLAAIGAVLSFGLAADPRSGWPLRALCAGASVVAMTTMYLSLSRGAWLALGVGLVVLVVLSAHRGSLLLTAIIVVLGSVAAIVRASGYPALLTDPHAGMGQAAAGHQFGLQLWGIALLVVAAQGVVAAGRASSSLMRTVDRWAPRLVRVLAALVALALLAGYGLKAANADGAVARGLDKGQNWIARQWHDFMRPTQPVATGTARLTSAGGSRSDLYGIALDSFEADPIAGEGAGSFAVRFVRHRSVHEAARNAHSLELETLGEEGLVGLALLLGFFGAAGRAVVRQRRHTGSLTRSQVAAVGGAVAVWMGHSAVDWDWQLSGLTSIVLVLMATAFPYGRRRRVRR